MRYKDIYDVTLYKNKLSLLNIVHKDDQQK